MLKSTLFFSCIVVLNYFTLITFPVIHIFILLLSICFSYPFVLENFLYFLFLFLSSAFFVLVLVRDIFLVMIIILDLFYVLVLVLGAGEGSRP